MKNSNQGIIHRLNGGKYDTNNQVEESVKEKLESLNQCSQPDIKDYTDTFNNWLVRTFRPDKKNNDINTHITYYTTKKPNNRGTYISDFDVVVENKKAPFSGLDTVNYFLSNYIGMIENEQLPDGDPNKKDKSIYFNKIKKTIPHYPAKIENKSRVISGGKKNGKSLRGNKKNRNKTQRRKSEKNKK